MLNEDAATVALASQAGFKCFLSIQSFKDYIMSDVIKEAA